MTPGKETSLEAHVQICEERYKNIINHLSSVERRLSEMNGRAWKAMWIVVLALGTGCASMIAYIWTFRVGP